MGDTSVGGVLVGLFLAILGILAILAGGYTVAETAFAHEGEERTEYGPLGLFGESEQSHAAVSLIPVMGLLIAIGGIVAAITGLVLTARSFERGKDRTVHD